MEKSKRELSKAIEALTRALHEEEEHVAADTAKTASALATAAVKGVDAPSITRSSDAIHREEFRQDAVKAAIEVRPMCVIGQGAVCCYLLFSCVPFHACCCIDYLADDAASTVYR